MIRRTNPRAGAMLLAALPLALQLAAEARQSAPVASRPDSPEYFETSVRPVLAANCYDCHADERMGGLRLDSRDGLLKGGKSGPALVPGDPEKSLLIEAVRQTRETLKMPKGGRLRSDEIEALTVWVRAGAMWPASAAASVGTTSTVASVGKPADTAPATASSSPAYVIKPEQRAFWSFQPIHTPPAPAVSHTSWPKTDIDRFVLARLEKDGLSPVHAADKLTLIRRATFDL